jgi:hypothetical protein
VRTKPLNRTSSRLENEYRLHVGVVAATVNGINFLADLPTTKATKFKSPLPDMLCMYFSAFTKPSYELKLLVVRKVKFVN